MSYATLMRERRRPILESPQSNSKSRSASKLAVPMPQLP